MIALSTRPNLAIAYLFGFTDDLEVLVSLWYMKEAWGVSDPSEDYIINLDTPQIEEAQLFRRQYTTANSLRQEIGRDTYYELLLAHGYDVCVAVAIASRHYDF